MSTMNASRGAISLPAAVACATLWLFSAMPASGQVDSAIDQAEAWLVSQQNPDGSIGSIPDLAPRDSAAAVLALAGRPGSEPAVTQSALYLEAVPEANAHFRSRRARPAGQPDHRFFVGAMQRAGELKIRERAIAVARVPPGPTGGLKLAITPSREVKWSSSGTVRA